MSDREYDSTTEVTSEIIQLAEAESLEEAVAKLNMLPLTGTSKIALKMLSPWTRGGAETYVTTFDITAGAECAPCILKACVAFAITPGGVEAILESWIARRRLLAAHGAAVPRLYAYGRGVVLEERLPYRAQDLIAAKSATRPAVLASLFKLTRALEQVRFQPVSILPDVMSDGERAVLVDFGQDLGDPMPAETDVDTYARTVASLTQLGINLSPEEQELTLAVHNGHVH